MTSRILGAIFLYFGIFLPRQTFVTSITKQINNMLRLLTKGLVICVRQVPMDIYPLT